MPTCAHCGDRPARTGCVLPRKGRLYRFCVECREAILKHEKHYGCKVGGQITKHGKGDLGWPHIWGTSGPRYCGGRVKMKPDLAQLDKAHAVYTPQERWKERR